jgi:hypothetical protein
MEPLVDWQHLEHKNKVHFAEKCSFPTKKKVKKKNKILHSTVLPAVFVTT